MWCKGGDAERGTRFGFCLGGLGFGGERQGVV